MSNLIFILLLGNDYGFLTMLYSKDVFKDRVKAILKKHKKAKVMILTDSSQAPSTEIEYPEEFQK